MKKIKSLVLMLIIFAMSVSIAGVVSTSASAAEATIIESGTAGENITWELDSDGTLAFYGYGEMKDYVFNTKYDGCNHISMTQYERPGYTKGRGTSISSLKVSEGITSIGAGALEGCQFSEVNLPSTIRKIGELAFYGCEHLRKINFPDGLESIGTGAFDSCQLEEVNLPKTVKSIGIMAFGPARYRKAINVGSIAIDKDNKHYTVVDGVVYTKDLSKLIFVPGGFTGECRVLPGTKSVGEWAIFRVEGLTSLVIPDGVTELGRWSVVENNNLRSIYIPKTVATIHFPTETAIQGNAALFEFYFGGTEAQWKELWKGDQYHPDARWFPNEKIYFGVPMPVKDVPSEWAEDDIREARNAGLTVEKGYQQPISREGAVAIAVRALELSQGKTISEILIERGISTDSVVFKDTTNPTILAANVLGIVNGMGDGRFDPDGLLTRAQFAAMINRVAKVCGVQTDGYLIQSFSDTTDHWVAPELGWQVVNGIIKGVGNNKFDPDGLLTTEQTIVISYRTLQVLG